MQLYLAGDHIIYSHSIFWPCVIQEVIESSSSVVGRLFIADKLLLLFFDAWPFLTFRIK